jgi:3-phosphoshikimate 1-carboxyvinyltransferase
MASLQANAHITIRWHGPYVSLPYIWMTVQQMKQFEATVSFMGHGNLVRIRRPPDHINFLIPAPQRFGVPNYHVQPDATAASYFWGAAALARGTIAVEALGRKKRLQGDMRFVNLLAEMGCKTRNSDTSIIVKGRPLHGIDADMNDISDTVMTLAVVACFAEGPTTIRNVAHIRHKETDRLTALATELRRIGAGVEEFADGLTITPRPLHGAEIETYNDHRMAMSMALIGLKVPGIVIKNPACVAKTYPDFFRDLERLRRA